MFSFQSPCVRRARKDDRFPVSEFKKSYAAMGGNIGDFIWLTMRDFQCFQSGFFIANGMDEEGNREGYERKKTKEEIQAIFNDWSEELKDNGSKA